MSPLISVIIPNHNYAKYLETTIESVLNQSVGRLDLIIVDNGSTDDSRDVICRYRGELTAIYQEDLGQASARNTGFMHAKGELISFLDADDYWEPRKLEMQLEKLNDDYQFIYSGLRQFDSESGLSIGSIKPKFEGDCSLAYLQFPTTAIVPAGESSVLMTQSLAVRVGKFNEKLNSATGRDFFRRCSHFTKFGYVDSELVNYRIHGNNMSSNQKLMMRDTELAYKLLFEDPDWMFASDYRRSCLTKLQWSHMKTNMKIRDFYGAIKGFPGLINPK
jgi:glycosyltransferase involved in cell wall biosynthesis